MQMDVYDFDGTLFHGDSTVAFVLFSLRRRPWLILYLPAIVWCSLLLLLKKCNLSQFKSVVFMFFRHIDVQKEATLFWSLPRIQKKLYPFFNPDASDVPVVIASASPQILLLPIAKQLGVPVVGTLVHEKTGQVLGKNCKGKEKIVRLKALWPNIEIRSMYTDSLTADAPLLRIAQRRYHVNKAGQVSELNDFS